MKIDSGDIKRLLSTGWQSWSNKAINEALFRFPALNYPPAEMDLPKYDNIPIPRLPKKPVTGWCSWYAYGWNINDKKILENSKWISKHKELPLEYVLIDGGWCVEGDWLNEDNRRFPNGLKGTVRKIKQVGLSARIWLAPFLVSPRANIAKEHPDWLVKKNGRFVDGLKLTHWNLPVKFQRWILDVRNPEVQEYLSKSISYLIKDCGFELLKLDFLYANHFNPYMTGKEADDFLHNFLSEIKNKYPSVYTIGCGCPLIPAIGTVDSMRIGADSIISPFLKFSSFARIIDRFLYGYTIKTLKERLWTKRFWNVDLDTYVCRKLSGLTERQILTHQKMIKEADGNIFLGDNLTRLPRDRIDKYIYPLFKQ